MPVGDLGWGWVAFAAFAVTALSGLAVKYGQHRFSSIELLNVWFIVALSLPGAYQDDGIKSSAGAQALAWLVGAALAIAYTFIVWLARNRTSQPQPAADLIPADTKSIPLTKSMIAFMVIRAAAVSIAVAIAFGLHVQEADWMPVATIAAMRSNLQQSTLMAAQRLAGAIIGAAIAALFLLTVHNKVALLIVVVILIALAGALRAVNYAWYCAAVAAAVLIGLGIPDPASFTDEARRVGFTFAGVAIAVVVTVFANLLNRRQAEHSQSTHAAGS